MEELLKSYLPAIEQELATLNIPSGPQNLYDPIRYFVGIGGKRIRPVLCIMGSDLFKGDRNVALPLATGLELFHNFTLIHDDIMDNAPLRRGKQTIHEKWNNHIGILSGDAMMILAYQSMLKSTTSKSQEIIRFFNEIALKVCDGQQKDMDFEREEMVSLDSYLKMIEEKTSVLLGASLKIGAMSAGANEKDANLLYDFGRQVGIAFQLKDDWLDIYANPDKFGKKVGGDILAGKKTYLYIKAVESMDDAGRHQLIQMYNDKSFAQEEKIEAVMEIYKKYNVGEALKEEMNKYFNKGLQALNQVNQPESEKQYLNKLAIDLMERES